MYIISVLDRHTFKISEMPSDTLGLTVGTGLGVSVLAGIISGVCFVIGYRNRISRRRNRKWHCNVCGENLRSVDFVLKNGQFVYCVNCNTKVCRSSCSVSGLDDTWICRSCSPKTDSWIDGAFRVVEPFTKALLARMNLVEQPPDELEEYYLNEERNREKEQLRDFIERLVNDILGENVDDASINKIYDDRNYLPLVGDSPCSAHTALKVIIQKIIREANELPQLRGEGTTNALEQNNRTYEDLLSTAILNKIISSSQNHLNLESASSSRTNSVYSHRSSSSKRRAQKEYFFGEETLDHKWKHIDTDTASVSSLEEWVHSDSSLGSTKYVDKVSLTIKQRIEEVSSSESDQEEDKPNNDDVDYFRSNSSFSNEEPNWFLQKKQFRGGTNSPVPVPMLVPDPTTDAKVLIGDREVDDTSDLSDVPSDFEEDADGKGGLMDVTNHLIESRSLIGGKNPLADLKSSRLSDDEVSADSGVKECKDLDEVDSEVLSSNQKHENDIAASICSDGSIAERDTEYTEKYATLPRTILIPREENSRTQKKESNQHNKASRLEDDVHTNGIEEESNEEDQIGFTGLYSLREKEKWKNAIELKNNPYSKENIERRIKTRNSINSLFGSDYYIRQARLPCGAKRTEVTKSDSSSAEDIFPIRDEDTIEDCQDSTRNIDFFTAKKIYTNETSPFSLDKPNNTNSLETNSLEPSDQDVILSSEITSDSEASLVNCYDVTESVVYRKLSKEEEEIQTAEKFFDFESLEASLNHEESNGGDQEEQIKPVAKPRTLLNPTTQNMVKTVATDDHCKLLRYREIPEDSFDAIPYVIKRKSDNTLIRKIYSNPSVRSFALNNRNKLPISIEKPATTKLAPPLIKASPEKKAASAAKKEEQKSSEVITQSEVILPSVPQKISNYEKDSEDKFADIDCFYARVFARSKDDHSPPGEIDELKEQKLVSNRLKALSKSAMNLSRISDESLDQSFSNTLNRNKVISADLESCDVEKIFENGERSTSVKDLRKKFEQFDARAKSEKPILYSLTGRSISKQFKERLRELNEDSLTLSHFHSLSLTNLEVEENTR